MPLQRLWALAMKLGMEWCPERLRRWQGASWSWQTAEQRVILSAHWRGRVQLELVLLNILFILVDLHLWSCSQRQQTDLTPPELDFKLIAWLEIQ
ncbi:MAG: hypothetical protein RLZZ609_1439 [Cyanobacteriota bacterium]